VENEPPNLAAVTPSAKRPDPRTLSYLRRMRCHLLAPALLITFASSAQTVHLLRALDFFFLPDTVLMLAGDSVKFQTQGPHNIMQVDQASWLANQPVGNGGFLTVIGVDSTFAIDTAGTYYFVCEPHGFMGMKGVLLVTPNGPTALGPIAATELCVFPNPVGDMLHISSPFDPGSSVVVTITDALGRIHAMTCTQQGNLLSCATGLLPRGATIVHVGSGPRSLRATVILE
jgi:plastocyanin